MFKLELNKILLELNNYKRNRFDLLVTYINDKLNESLKTYSGDLSDSQKYLESCNVARVARNIGKKR